VLKRAGGEAEVRIFGLKSWTPDSGRDGGWKEEEGEGHGDTEMLLVRWTTAGGHSHQSQSGEGKQA